jgi:hypothetical protein
VLEKLARGLVNMTRITTAMYIHDAMVAYLSWLCGAFGVTPDTIETIKDRSHRPRLTPRESAARVRSMIAS